MSMAEEIKKELAEHKAKQRQGLIDIVKDEAIADRVIESRWLADYIENQV